MTPSKPEQQALWAAAAKVRLLILDCDGVLTDGGLYYGAEGEALKRFDVKDGHGLVMARLVGLPTAVISGRQTRIVEVRGKELGFIAIHGGSRDKRDALDALCAAQGISPAECAYVGDDLNDLGPMAEVGFSACPADAVPEVRQSALFVTQSAGGRGAVREVVELLLRASGRWDQAIGLMMTERRVTK